MASKPVDNSVNERRLRPIYDWLDNGSNKKALQESDKVLKKQPHLQCAKVLKALALVRLGRVEEAQVILKEVQKEEPYEDATLQAMAICFRETHQPELTCQAYESAIKKDPQNEEFLSHLFMSYVRVGDYRKQQLTAMALYKVKSKNPYYFWAVMSILMQAYGADEKVCLTVTLPLAERLIKKFVDDKKIEAEAEVQLYLMVLEKQGKFQEALDVVKGPLGEKLSDGAVETKEVEYLRLLKRWDRVMECYAALIAQNPDQWNYYVQYVEAAFEISSQDDTALSQAAEFILGMTRQESQKQSEKLRGPYLAPILLWQQLQKRGIDSVALLGDVRLFFEDYVAVFGEKPCAFLDLKPFVHNFPADQVTQFLDYVERSIGLEPGQSPATTKQLCRHLLHLQLSRNLGRHETLDREEKIRLSNQLTVHYESTKFLNAGLLPTDFRPNDGYALLAAHLLLDAWNHDSKILFKCLALLENALSNSPANYHLKLLTTRLYTLAGHGRAAFQLYETLDIKYIQLDSLGHLLSRPLISMGLPQVALPILASTLKFYMTHAKETSECLIAAYKYGSFSKIPEFTQFSKRLDSSVHFAAVTTERLILELLLDNQTHAKLVQVAQGMSADPDRDQPNWNSFIDNRDLKIFVSWDPPSKQINEEEVKNTFTGEVRFARLRNRLLHAVVSAVSTSPNWLAEGQTVANGQHEHSSGAGVLRRLLDELRSLLGELKPESFVNHSQFSIQSPPPPRLYTYAVDGCLEPLLVVLDVVVALHGGTAASADTASDYRRGLDRVVQAAAAVHSTIGFWKTYVHLERIYNAVEVLGLCTIVLSTLHATIKANKNPGKKKKKTSSSNLGVVVDSTAETFPNLVEATRAGLKEVENLVNQLDVETSADLLDISDDSSVTSLSHDIRCKLSQSPSAEMRAMIADKLKLLESCCV